MSEEGRGGGGSKISRKVRERSDFEVERHPCESLPAAREREENSVP